MELFGKVHPSHRLYSQWDQMQESERQLHRRDMADLFIRTAERYGHSAIFLHPNPGTLEETRRLIELVREKTGDTYFLMLHGDATYSIPDGDGMLEFVYRMADEPEAVKAKADAMVDAALKQAEQLRQPGGLDGFALCAEARSLSGKGQAHYFPLHEGRAFAPRHVRPQAEAAAGRRQSGR